MIQDKEINIEFNCDDALEDKELVVAICLYSIGTDNRFNVYHLRKPHKIEGNTLYYRDTIPNNAAIINIDMMHPDFNYHLDHLDQESIFTNEHVYCAGALNNLTLRS